MGLIFTFEGLLKLSKHFHKVLLINFTYGTNYFRYLLYQVTGLIYANTIFNSVFGLINNEKKEVFNFLYQVTKEIQEERGIPAPKVILTNQCKELKAALTETFPNT